MNDLEIKHWQIKVTLEPEGTVKYLARPKTVIALLNRLKLKSASVLVIRENTLLTPDREINGGDEIILRSVVSSG